MNETTPAEGPPNLNTKAKGRRRELAVRDFYLRRGWLVCVSAASLGIDLVVSNPERRRLDYISVKANSWPPKVEMDYLNALANRVSRNTRGKWRVLIFRFDDYAGVTIRRIGHLGTISRIHLDKLPIAA